MPFWSGNAIFIDNSTGPAGNVVEFNDVFVAAPVTLLRSIVWVHVQTYTRYDQGDTGQMTVPCSWAFADVNSVHHSPGTISGNPGNAEEELLSTSMVPMVYTGLGWPPNSSGHLTGSVNDLASDATLATDYNSNQFMYGSGVSMVDSRAQRHFTELPTYAFALHDWATGVGGGDRPAMKAWAMIRLLYNQE